jgi:hypothetical protein
MPVSIPKPYTHVYLNTALYRSRSTREIGAFRETSGPFGLLAALDRKILSPEMQNLSKNLETTSEFQAPRG